MTTTLWVPRELDQETATTAIDWTAQTKSPSIGLQEVIERYDIVEATGDYLVVTPKDERALAQQYAEPDMRELGTTGSSNYGNVFREEYKSELRGQQGLRTYDKMRRSNAVVRSSLRLVKTVVLGARWYTDPANNSDLAQTTSDFIWAALTKRTSHTWTQFLSEALNFLDYGFYPFEKVYKKEDGNVLWQKFAARHPIDLYEWVYDDNGGPNGGRFYGPEGGIDERFIDISKLIVFVFDQEGGDMHGFPLLRSAYMHWYFIQNLYKIDAIQKERHGVGIPIIKLPPGYTEKDKLLANEIGRNLRTNEKAHVVLPPMWVIEWANISTQSVDIIKSVEHHNNMIAINILAPFMFGEGGDNFNIFLKSTRFVADIVRDVINKWAIPEMAGWNFRGVDEYPELKVRRIGEEVDWRTISFAVRNLVGAGVLTVDDELEDHLRNEMDAPRRGNNPRIVATPQAPRVGPPRQAPAANTTQGTTPGNNGRVGIDQSGG